MDITAEISSVPDSRVGWMRWEGAGGGREQWVGGVDVEAVDTCWWRGVGREW